VHFGPMHSFIVPNKCTTSNTYKAELDLSGRWLLGSPIIWIGLALRLNSSRILQN